MKKWISPKDRPFRKAHQMFLVITNFFLNGQVEPLLHDNCRYETRPASVGPHKKFVVFFSYIAQRAKPTVTMEYLRQNMLFSAKSTEWLSDHEIDF